MTLPTNKNKKRIVVLFFTLGFIFIALIIRLGWIQIVSSEKYQQLALEQQTRDIPIPAKRGIIFDRKGKELAVSASTSTIWARPSEVKNANNIDETVRILSETLGEDPENIKQIITKSDVNLIRVAKWVEKEKADIIREAKLDGIWIAEDNKRIYPYGSFAAHILGHTTDDNRGLSGIELKYDKYLSGLPGRWIKNTDALGRQLSYGTEKYYKAENGLNTVLTIDEVIQHFVEKAIENAYEKTNSKKVMAIVMDPETGDILAMANFPDYDPNNSREPILEKDLLYYRSLDNDTKQNYWNSMWRNPIISDTYEPGSTFKLITTAIALNENVTSPGSEYNCTGYITVGDARLRCWRYYSPHGHQTLTEAVQNSCNPVFIQLGLGVGKDKYYEYLNSFGFIDKTGIDLPGESTAIIQNKSAIGPVELATISYGQGISVTPIQLITAVSAIGNEGKLMRPRIVKELVDDDGNVIHRFEPEMIRQVISKETANEMTLIMEQVVAEGTGKNAQVAGYRIGGKTGTADKVIDGRYVEGKVYSSFIALAPIDDPKIAVLVIVDEPEGTHFGSLTAAPAAREILADSLRYLNIKQYYSQEELEKMKNEYVYVPDIRNKIRSEAILELAEYGLGAEIVPEDEIDDFVVEDQYPKPGELVRKNVSVYLYKN
ncbi:MAG: stage V sporulation protein D [Clostridiales bacterium]|nr:stage V sporulation protein D [Clostridiales bacterium]